MQPLVVFGVVLLAAVYLADLLIRKYRLKWHVMGLGIPRMQGIPILDNFLQFVKLINLAPGVPHSVYLMEQLKGFVHLMNQKGLLFASVGPTYYLGVTTASTVETLLSDNFEVNKSGEYGFTKDWLGTGLITSSYAKWKVHRKMLTPAFHFRILDQFQPIMNSQADVLIRRLRQETFKPFVSIVPAITNCALDIIAETAMGIELGAQKSGDSSFVNSLQKVESLLFKRICSPWLWPDLLFRLSPTGIKYHQNLEVVRKFVKKVIADRKLKIEKEWSKDGELVAPPDKRLAFLDMLLLTNANSRTLSEQDLEDEVHTFTFAGHDTTTSGMSWTLYMLGLYPEVQAKVQDELEEVFGRDHLPDVVVTLEHLKSLPYLELVIKETMRLYPPVPIIGRMLRKDFAIDGVTIPAGSTVLLPVTVVHRDPLHFPDPEVFRPERFLEASRHPFAYIPFSAGPRNCIGQRYAMLEMKTILCKILLNFRLTSLDSRDQVLMAVEVVSTPSRPIRIKIQDRFKLDS